MLGAGAQQVASLFAVIGADLGPLNTGLRRAAVALQRYQNRFQRAGQEIAQIGRTLSLGVTIPIVGMGTAIVNAAAQWESAFTGVRKTVEGTEEQLQALDRAIRDMSKGIPETPKDLARIAEIAGQLGIPISDIEGFTRTIAGLAVSTNMAAEEGAKMMAQFLNITKTVAPAQMTLAQQTERVGAAVVELGNNFATTENDIMQMAFRIAGAGAAVGATQADILGLATGLSSLGIRAEMGGSAISRVMLDIESAVSKGGAKLSAFVRIAGMGVEEFKALWDSDPTGVITRIIKGLGNINATGGNVVSTLEALGLNNIRVRDSLLRAATGVDRLEEALRMSRSAYAENTALTEEAGKRYATFESQLQIVKNYVNDLAITLGQTFLPILKDLLRGLHPVIQGMIDWAKSNPDQVKLAASIALVAAALGPLLLVISALLTPLGAATAGMALLTGVMVKNKDKVKAFAQTIKSSLGGAIRALGQGLSKMNKPLGDAIFAIGAYVSGWTDLSFAKDIVANTLFSFRDALGGIESPLGKVIGLLGILLRGTADASTVFAEIGKTVRETFEDFGLGKFLKALSIAIINAPSLGAKIVDFFFISAEALGTWAKTQVDNLRDTLAKQLGVSASWERIGNALIDRIAYTTERLGQWANGVIGGIRSRLAERLEVEPSWSAIAWALIEKMLPALQSLMDFGGKMIDRVRKAISYSLTQSPDASWGDIAQMMVEKILKGAVNVVNFVADLTGKIKEAVSSESAQKNLENAGHSVAKAIRDFIGGLFASPETGTSLLAKLAEGIGRATANIGDTAKAIAKPFIQGFIEEISGKAMSEGAAQALDASLGLLAGMMNPAYAAAKLLPSAKEFSEAWQANNNLQDMPWYTITNDLYSHLDTTLQEIKEKAIGIGTAIINGMSSGIESTKTNFLNAIVNYVRDMVLSARRELQIRSPSQVFFEIGVQTMAGLKGGILSKAGEIAAAAANVVRTAIAAARAAAGIASPSKVFLRIGEQLAEGLALGLSNKQNDVLDNLKKLMDWTGAIKSIASAMSSYIKSTAIGGLEQQLKDIDAEIERLSKRFGRTSAEQKRLNSLLERRAKIVSSIEKSEGAIADIQARQQTLDFLQAQINLLNLIAENKLRAKDILGGLELGINASAQGVMEAMIRALDMLIQKTQEQLGIASPSKTFAWMGEQLMRGLTRGIYRGALDPVMAVSRVTGTTEAAAQTTINRKDTIIIRDRAAEVAFAQSRRETALRRLAVGAM